MGIMEDELRRRLTHMREEREHVDFMEKTAALIRRRVARGVPADQQEGTAASLEALVQINRALRERAGSPADPGELAAESDLEALVADLRTR